MREDIWESPPISLECNIEHEIMEQLRDKAKWHHLKIQTVIDH